MSCVFLLMEEARHLLGLIFSKKKKKKERKKETKKRRFAHIF